MPEITRIKLKYVADIFNGNSIPDDKKSDYEGKSIPYIPTKELSVEDGSINYDNGLSVDEDDGFRIAPSESVLMCIEGGSAGKKIGFTNQPVAFVNKLCCIHGTTVNQKFLYHSLRSKDFTEQFFLNMTGLIGGVTVSVLKNLYITLTIDKEQQELISAHLDRKCTQIDTLIANQEQQIEKLKAYKQSIITETVTKGLDPDVEMKDSEVDWIGEIPEHWEVTRFGRICKVKSNLVHPENYPDYIQIAPDNIEKGSGNLLPCQTVKESGVISDNHLFYKGQIIYSKIRPILNKVTIAPFDGLCSADMYPIETTQNYRYVLYYMLSNLFLIQVKMVTENRVKMPKINQEEISQIITVFPHIEEQNEIVTLLDEKCSQIDKLITLKQQKIEKLQQYKKSLIYEYVTGKKEV